MSHQKVKVKGDGHTCI